jgi:small neutral amino acid transporter SnatA (MarC family)
MNVRNNEADLLRTALLANCVFSGLSGIILLFGSNRLSGLFGLHMPTILIGAGVLLLVYAAALLLNA